MRQMLYRPRSILVHYRMQIRIFSHSPNPPRISRSAPQIQPTGIWYLCISANFLISSNPSHIFQICVLQACVCTRIHVDPQFLHARPAYLDPPRKSVPQAYINICVDPPFLNQRHTTSFTYLLPNHPAFSTFI